MASPVILFASEALANRLVAGIPAAARALHNFAGSAELKPDSECIVAVAGGWRPSSWCRKEWARLVPDVKPIASDSVQFEPGDVRPAYRGGQLAAGDVQGAGTCLSQLLQEQPGRERAEEVLLREADKAIVAATGKTTDGVISRYVNRPISRLITRALLHIPGVTPLHGTLTAAAIGIVMAGFLFFDLERGLVTGALLFQTASIIDGVDGEIARSTFRTSERGASLDSLTDGATNLAFVAGASFNLWQHGLRASAYAGAAGLVLLAIGLALLAFQSRRAGGAYNFDAVKQHFRAGRSPLRSILASCISRDCYAALFAVLFLLGLAAPAMLTFAAVVIAWFITTIVVLVRLRGTH